MKRAVAEAAGGAKDPEVVRLARDQGRVLLTEDKDFGWYVYASGEGGVGVILIRFPAASRRLLGGGGSAYILHARSLTEGEKRRYRRQRR